MEKVKKVYDVIGREIEVSENQWCVTATDKMLSGWGRAEGKTHKQIVICENHQQAERIAGNMRAKSFVYVNARVGLPYYSPSRFTTSYHHANDCPIWNK